MAVPISQATVSGFHTIELPNNILAPTFTVPLMGDTTGAPIEEWEWNVAASGENHRGGAPYGSLVASGIKGSFTDGVAKVQNPTAILDTPGGYTFSLRTRNTDGWSDPSYTGDGWRCQTNVYVLTQAGLKLPAPNEYNYEYDLHDTLNTLASGGSSSNYAEDSLHVTDGAQVTITLTYTPTSISAISVYRNGVYMEYVAGLGSDHNQYTWDGDKTITLVSPTTSGEWYACKYTY